MPTYDYVCGNCGHRIEVIHGVHAAGPDECPNCHARGQMRKAIVSPTVLYKGSGWAKKDRGASASTKAAAKAAGESGGSSTSSESAGSESSKGSDKGDSSPDKSSDAGSSSSKSGSDTGAGGSTASTTTSKGD
jgi:putative FmdB family regulatory protein